MKGVFKLVGFQDIMRLYALFFLIAGSMYFAPKFITVILLLVLLIAFYRSEKGYFWLAFFFIIHSEPGSLFKTSDFSHALVILPSSPAGALFYWMLIVLVGVIKTYSIKRKHPFFLNNVLFVFAVYVFILLLAFNFHKISFVNGFISWALLYIIPRTLKNVEDYEKFFNLIFSFIFFVLVSQIFYLVTGSEFNVLLGGALNRNYDISVAYAVVALRPTSGISITFMALIGAVIFITYKKSILSKNYLYLIIGGSLFSIFLTATRGWMIAAVVIFIAFLIISSKNPFSVIPKLVIPITLILIIFNFVPLLKKQSDMVLQRFESMIMLAEGDETAGGTLSRLDERGPRVMNKFAESPLLGFGFGSEAHEFNDGHVGNHNLLLQSGILGYFLWVVFWLSYIVKLLFRERELLPSNPYKNISFLLIASFLAIFIIHSSSSQWFGFRIGFIRGFIWFILLTFGNLFYWESRNANYKEK